MTTEMKHSHTRYDIHLLSPRRKGHKEKPFCANAVSLNPAGG
jgi:hypothetical protein